LGCNHGGTVDKFIGDAIMAWWLLTDKNAKAAAQCLMHLMENARDPRFANLRPGDAHDAAVSGFGMHCGIAYECCLGNRDRFELALIGSTINIASRLESATRERGIAVLSNDLVSAMGADTMETALTARGFQLQAPDDILLKGIPRPLICRTVTI
jgi:adenylate cyclase